MHFLALSIHLHHNQNSPQQAYTAVTISNEQLRLFSKILKETRFEGLHCKKQKSFSLRPGRPGEYLSPWMQLKSRRSREYLFCQNHLRFASSTIRIEHNPCWNPPHIGGAIKARMQTRGICIQHHPYWNQPLLKPMPYWWGNQSKNENQRKNGTWWMAQHYVDLTSEPMPPFTISWIRKISYRRYFSVQITHTWWIARHSIDLTSEPMLVDNFIHFRIPYQRF